MTVNQSLREQLYTILPCQSPGACAGEEYNGQIVFCHNCIARLKLLPLIQQLLEGAEQAGHIDGHACAGSNLPCDRWKGALDRLLEAARAEAYNLGYSDGRKLAEPAASAEPPHRCPYCGIDLDKLPPEANLYPHRTGGCNLFAQTAEPPEVTE